MDIAKFSLKNKLLIYVLTILSIAYGLVVYDKIGKLQDPEFTIKDALIITNYPGASAIEVEKEVSDRLEETLQTLPGVRISIWDDWEVEWEGCGMRSQHGGTGRSENKRLPQRHVG